MKFIPPSWTLYVAVPLIIAWCFIVDFNPSGVRRLQYSVAGSSSMITPLFPAQRLFGVEDGSQRLKMEPVYFRVRYPRAYREAALTVSVENPEDLDWAIGLESGDGEWSYDLQPAGADGSVIFDLQAAKVTDHSLRFMVAVPALSSGSFFAVTAIDVILRDKI